VTGSAFNDSVTGNARDNLIAGLDGADTIFGGFRQRHHRRRRRKRLPLRR
jgi:hypothetical protein